VLLVAFGWLGLAAGDGGFSQPKRVIARISSAKASNFVWARDRKTRYLSLFASMNSTKISPLSLTSEAADSVVDWILGGVRRMCEYNYQHHRILGTGSV
jgi:hypothetical protein